MLTNEGAFAGSSIVYAQMEESAVKAHNMIAEVMAKIPSLRKLPETAQEI